MEDKMSTIKVLTVLSDLDNKINQAMVDAMTDLTADFKGSTDNNEQTEAEHVMNIAMATQKIASKLTTRFKKDHDQSKKALDRACENLVGSSSATPGETTTLYSDSLFVFSKRMNEDSFVCSAKDLVIELNKLGVDPDIIAKAQEAATKVKKGNVYYNVDVNEHEG